MCWRALKIDHLRSLNLDQVIAMVSSADGFAAVKGILLDLENAQETLEAA